MSKARLEAFSDGVIAILITILVLELKIPQTADLNGLRPMLPIFLAYVLSFANIGIYWNNHHHMLHATTRVNGKVLWANLYLLFWLSLIPYMTEWMGENRRAAVPTALYGVVLLMAAFGYLFLQNAIIAEEGPKSKLAQAVGRDRKGRLSQLLYIIAIAVAPVKAWLSQALYVTVAMLWLVPDKRIEDRS